MLPQLNLLLRLNTVRLSKPLTQAQNNLVDILLEFHRIVKGALNGKGILKDLREFPTLKEPLEGVPRFVADLDFFGAYPGFAFELLGRHKEVKKRGQRRIDGGQEGLFLKALKPVAADVFTDDGTVFLFDSDRRPANSYRFSGGAGWGRRGGVFWRTRFRWHD
jgi:hypothetical protein